MRRADLEPVSAVAGAVFVLLGVAFLADEASAFELQVRWVWPVLLIALGIAGLVGSRPGDR